MTLLVLSPFVAAQDKDKNNEKLVQIKFDKGTEIAEILDHIRKSTRRPLLYDASDTRIRSRKLATDFSTKVPDDKLFSVFRAMLAFFELTLVPIGPQGYEIYLVISSRSTNNLVKNKAEYVDYKDIDRYRDQDGLYISCAIPIRHIENLQLLRTALSTMISPAGIGRVHEVSSSQSLIIMDFAPTVWAMVQLIKQMDVEPPGRKMVMEFIELKFAFADEVADIVSELVSAQRQAVTQPRPGQAFRASQTPEPRILAYEPRNALVIAATEDDFKLIKSLIDRFDQEEGEESRVEIVRLKHVEAEDIADTLQTVLEGLQGQLPGTTRTPAGRPRGAGTTRTGGRTRDVEPQVVPDPGTNALIITGDRKTIQALKDIIKEMDQPKDQVLIEAAIISVQRTDEFELGVEIVGVDDTGLNENTASGFGFTNFGLSTFEDTDGDLIPDINIPNALTTPGGGLVAGIFRNGNIPIFLNAIQRLQNAKIISMPSVITYENEEATLEALSQEPTGVTTDLASGGVQSGFDDFASAGVILHVSPHISADNYLRLNIEVEVSSFTGEPPAAGFPSPRQQNILTTTIALPNEHTVVMGGLISEEEAVQEAKVPILGDLPIIGYLFKNRSRRRIKRNLFMFVTPHILRQHANSFDDLHRQSWIAKQKADKLIEHVEIHNSRFRDDPRYKDELAEEDGEAKLDIGSLLDAGIFVDVNSQETIDDIRRLRREAKAKK